MKDQRYITIPNWERFQHYKDRQPAWVKLHLSLLGNDAWLSLSPEDRVLLITIWMLVGRYGNGRVIASLSWLQSQANLPLSNRYRGLQRLSDAGFVEVSASTVETSERSLDLKEEIDTPLPPTESGGTGGKRRGTGTSDREVAERAERTAKRAAAHAACKRTYNGYLEAGEKPDTAREWMLNEYRHDPSIVDEALKGVA